MRFDKGKRTKMYKNSIGIREREVMTGRLYNNKIEKTWNTLGFKWAGAQPV